MEIQISSHVNSFLSTNKSLVKNSWNAIRNFDRFQRFVFGHRVTRFKSRIVSILELFASAIETQAVFGNPKRKRGITAGFLAYASGFQIKATLPLGGSARGRGGWTDLLNRSWHFTLPSLCSTLPEGG